MYQTALLSLRARNEVIWLCVSKYLDAVHAETQIITIYPYLPLKSSVRWTWMLEYTYIITLRNIQYYFGCKILNVSHVKGLNQLFSFLAALKINSMTYEVDQRLLFSSRIWILDNNILSSILERGIYATNIYKNW